MLILEPSVGLANGFNVVRLTDIPIELRLLGPASLKISRGTRLSKSVSLTLSAAIDILPCQMSPKRLPTVALL